MDYCEKINYFLFVTDRETFPSRVDHLLDQIPEGMFVLRLAFFGTPATNEEYLERRSILKGKVMARYGGRTPVISYVSQPPLNAPLILEVHAYRPDEDDRVSYRRLGDYTYVLVENDKGRFLFAGGFQNNILSHPIGKQAQEVFVKMIRLLEEEDFPVDSIVRQWNYIERITASDGGNQHYQSFNNARSAFYAGVDWTNGYPAATGIGTNLGGVLVDLDAAVFTSPDTFATPIDNKLQVAAHSYSDKVLETSLNHKTTPKFERAKSITSGNRRLVYISGTAAIRGEESLRGVGIEKQLHATMENIAQLAPLEALIMLRVYLKNRDDYAMARRMLDDYGLGVPVSYMCTDVCREELLIEIEGIAIEQLK